MLPFNIELIRLDRDRLSRLKPVLSLDIYDGASSNFHEDGLFSVSIFGRVGSEQRDLQFSYIDIKTTVFHPVIYRRLIKLRGMYRDIMAGKAYARWDDEEKDFVAASPLDGETGFHFFVTHWEKIQFKRTKSLIRNQNIELIEKYRDRAMTDKILVLPAGLRDFRVDENGRQMEEEINTHYRRVLSIANTIGVKGEAAQSEVFNTARHSLQLTFNEIYASLERLLTGKKGFIQKKWGSRNIFNGTRNVITAMDTSTPVLGQPNSPKPNDTAVGLFQTMKAALPVAKNLILNGPLRHAFSQPDGRALLIDKRTLKPEYVEIDSEVYDRWATPEGIERAINAYREVEIRHRPVEIEGRYVGLIYLSPNQEFRIFYDIDELPEDRSRDDVFPLTYCQLFYLSGYRRWNTLRAYVTRYPVTGIGSIYPTRIYVKTTTTGEMRWELNENWERIGDDHVALEFPRSDIHTHLDSMQIHPAKLKQLGGD